MPTIARVEGRFAHQPVNAGFCAQPAECVLSLKLDGGTLDTCDLAGGYLDQFGPEPLGLSPAQVHPQEHLSPVLGLGTSRARLDIKKGIVGIHLAAEHSTKFKFFEHLQQAAYLPLDLPSRFLVVLGRSHLQQVGGVGRAAIEFLDGVDNAFQGGSLAPKLLGPAGVVPDAGLGQFKLYLGEAFLTIIEVKDTP